MNPKELRKQAIKRYKNGESPKEIYQILGKDKTWLLKWLKHFKYDLKIGSKQNIEILSYSQTFTKKLY